jgi:crotonyl-CoA carboxylase/reductase
MSESEDRPWRSPLREARVGDAMHPGVVFCTPETPLRTVARIMADRRIHAVVVSDLDMPVSKHRWGVVSDIDLLGAAQGDVGPRTAGEIARTVLRTISREDALADAARIMAEHGITHLVVVEADGSRAVGVLSSLDIAGALAASDVSGRPPRH